MAVESAEIGTWDFNPITGESRWSNRAKIMFGLPVDTDVTDVSFLDRLHPDDRERRAGGAEGARSQWRRHLRHRLPIGHSRGVVRWFIAKGQVMFECERPNRRATRFIGTVMEITARKQAEIALSEAEKRFSHGGVPGAGRHLSDRQRWPMSVRQSGVVRNRGGRARRGHGRWLAAIRASRRSAASHSGNDELRRVGVTIHKSVSQSRIRPPLGHRLGRGDPGCHRRGQRVRRHDRRRYQAQGCPKTSFGPVRRRLKGFLDDSTAVIALKDLDSRYLLVNRQWEIRFGKQQDQVVGRTPSPMLRQDTAQLLRNNDLSVIRSGESIVVEENINEPDGIHTYITVKFPIKDSHGQVAAVGESQRTLRIARKPWKHSRLDQDFCGTRSKCKANVDSSPTKFTTDWCNTRPAPDAVGIGSRPGGAADVAEQVENVIGLLKKTVAEGRRLINGIRTPVLDTGESSPPSSNSSTRKSEAHVDVEFVKDPSIGRMTPDLGRGAVSHHSRGNDQRSQAQPEQ